MAQLAVGKLPTWSTPFYRCIINCDYRYFSPTPFDGRGRQYQPASKWCKRCYISNTIDPIVSQTSYQYAHESSLFPTLAKLIMDTMINTLVFCYLESRWFILLWQNNVLVTSRPFSLLEGYCRRFLEMAHHQQLKVQSWGQTANDRIGDYPLPPL